MKTLLNTFPLKLTVISNEVITIMQDNTTWLLLNLKDNTRISVNNVTNSLSENDIVVVNSYDICTVFKSNSTLIALEINKTFLNLNEADKQSYFVCNSTAYKDKSKFYKLRASIIGLITEHKSISQSQAFSVAYGIYDELLKNFSQIRARKKDANNKIIQIIEYIEQNYTENLLLSDIAEHFNFSVPYLSKLFKSSTGKTFADFYDEIRINHSLYDLLETDTTIIDIAYKHGFANNHAYIRAYKKIKGVLPNEARKSHNPSGAEKLPPIDNFSELLDIINQSEPPENDNYNAYYIDEDYNADSKDYLPAKPCQEILGIGPATLIFRSEIKKIITTIQQLYPFRHAYIRGIFSDRLSFCTRGNDGNLIYKFTMIDEILDYLMGLNLMPVLSFAYMPKELMGKINCVDFDGYNPSGPKNLDEWKQIVSTFISHTISRYGINSVKKWIFIPWLLPDSDNTHLGFANDDEFFEFYKATFDSIKSVSAELTVSSPELFIPKDYEWFGNYLQWTANNGCRPDILSIIYPDFNWEIFKTQKNARYVINDNQKEFLKNENTMHNMLVSLKEFLESNGNNLDIYITEFVPTAINSIPIWDTLFAADFFVKNYVDNYRLIKSLSCWRLIDYDEESMNSAFKGGTGMYLPNGVPKGMSQALKVLWYTQPYIIDSGKYFFFSKISNQTNVFNLLIFNYVHPYTDDNIDITSSDINTLNFLIKKEKILIHFKVQNVPYKFALIKAYILDNEHGAVYEKWITMGQPDINIYSERNGAVSRIFNATSQPDYKQYVIPINDNTLYCKFSLNPLDIIGMEITFLNEVPNN
ncbi:MAG: helix-turn-helix domain-containing protein [Roseburia sp.]|nr:helix-turn-helix domain-containing protein [Roseburia sp.]